MLPLSVSSRQVICFAAVVSAASVLTRWVPPGSDGDGPYLSTRKASNHPPAPTKSATGSVAPPRSVRGRPRPARPTSGRPSGWPSRSCRGRIDSFGACAWSSGWHEAEQDDRQAQDGLEAGADRDRAALADVQRRLPEGRLEGSGGRLRRRVIDRGQARAARRARSWTVTVTPGGAISLDVRLERLEDPVRILGGDQPAAHLGVGVGRDDRLGAVALEATPDPVDVERRPGAAPLERREARPRRRAPATPSSAMVRVLVERQGARWARSSSVSDRDVVVEAGDPDPPVRALERRR